MWRVSAAAVVGITLHTSTLGISRKVHGALGPLRNRSGRLYAAYDTAMARITVEVINKTLRINRTLMPGVVCDRLSRQHGILTQLTVRVLQQVPI